MSRSSYLKFNCPSCGQKLAGIEPRRSPQVVQRTCPLCHDRWLLVICAGKSGIDKVEFTLKYTRDAVKR